MQHVETNEIVKKKTIFSIFDESFDGATRYELTMQSLGSEVRIIWKLTQPLNENESVKSEEIKSERSWSKSLFRNIDILICLFSSQMKRNYSAKFDLKVK